MLCDLGDYINTSIMTYLSRLAAGEQKIIVVLLLHWFCISE